MKNKWRIVFCGLWGLVELGALIISIWLALFGYLFTGLLIWLIGDFCGSGWIIILWLPALWSERVLEFWQNI